MRPLGVLTDVAARRASITASSTPSRTARKSSSSSEAVKATSTSLTVEKASA